MGNLCGKQESDAFAQPGRTLGSAPPPSGGTAPVPSSAARKPATVGGPPRTLGGGGGGAGGGADDARRKAAAAAEARAKALEGKPSGKLGSQAQALKKQSRTDTLKDAGEAERRRREIEQGADVLSYN